MDDKLGTALEGRYTIDRELGAGGMATVFLAKDLRHDRQVAIKVLKPELAAVIGAERFLREIKTIASLQHPHILGLIDSGQVNGTAYYVVSARNWIPAGPSDLVSRRGTTARPSHRMADALSSM